MKTFFSLTIFAMNIAVNAGMNILFEKDPAVTPEGVAKVVCKLGGDEMQYCTDATETDCKTYSCSDRRELQEDPAATGKHHLRWEDRKLQHSWCRFFCRPSGGTHPSALWCSYNCPCFRRELSLHDQCTSDPSKAETDALEMMAEAESEVDFSVKDTVDVFC